MRDKVAIVGTNTRSRDKPPWDDPDMDFWVFNEAGNQPWVKGRVDAVFQMHTDIVFRNPNNKSDKDHWKWLQKKRGFPIYMQSSHPEIPDSVEYPLEDICKKYLPDFKFYDRETPIRFFASTIAYALALGIHLDYKELHLFGIEQASNTEYFYQRACTAFWIGVAVSQGIKVILHCAQGIFDTPLYGYEGELQIQAEEYSEGISQLEPKLQELLDASTKATEEFNQALQGSGEDIKERLNKLLGSIRQAATIKGIIEESNRYKEKAKENGSGQIIRQEFEHQAAVAQQSRERYVALMNFEAGRSWTSWDIYSKTQTKDSLETYMQFLTKQLFYCRMAGEADGARLANIKNLSEIDKKIRAAGGIKAAEMAGG